MSAADTRRSFAAWAGPAMRCLCRDGVEIGVIETDVRFEGDRFEALQASR